MSLPLLWAALGGEGDGWHMLRVGGDAHWAQADNQRRLSFLAEALPEDLMIGTVPYLDRAPGLHAAGSVLWCRTETLASEALMARFDPQPTIRLREGSTARTVALWAIRRTLTPLTLERANRRLAHALGAPKKWCGPEFEFPLPGTSLTRGRKRPIVVQVDGGSGELYPAKRVVGALRDAPDPNFWKQRQAA